VFRLIQSIVAFAIRLILSLRYRVRVEGLDRIDAKEGVLILPNHPGEMDPAIVISQLWRFRPHPVVVEDFFYLGGLKLLMRVAGAIPMPNTATGLGSYKRLRIQQSLDNVVDLLEKGESVAMYPAGRLMRGTREDLRGVSGLSDILHRNPNINLVIVRTTGLIGSSFSWVVHNERPDLGQCLKFGFVHVLKNLIFFTPRRDILIEVMEPPTEFPRGGDRMAINTWLEDWYNAKGDEEIRQISYSCWGEVLHKIEAADGPVALPETSEVPADVRERTYAYLAEVGGMPVDEINDGQNLSNDLGLDSLMLADLLAWLDESFYVQDVELTDIGTVGDVLIAAAGHVKHAEHHDVEPPDGWFESKPRPELRSLNLEMPISRQFLETCDSMRNYVAMADEAGGVLTYGRAKIGALLMADIIAEYPERNIGIMLPASAGANVLAVATLLAGKVPVMINWTLGDANLEHVIEMAEIKRIITSGRFLDKLDQFNIDMLADRLVVLEDLRAEKITTGRKIGAALKARRSVASLSKDYALDTNVDEPAVILFTSGSEAAPKGVPLSHRNIMANVVGCIESASLRGSDVLFGFLPPFHSFGFTVTGMLPLLSGLKTAYYPNPTESRRLVHGARMWQPTTICGTPTFIMGLCKAAGGQPLTGVEQIVVGAEKPGPELYDLVEKTSGAALLQGYGITECGPVLTLTQRGAEQIGVGQPIGDVQIKVVDPDTRLPVAEGSRGLILVRGSNVFSGYLGRESADAFAELDGNYYYITGDLGFVDADGNLTLAGRLKRFVKIGGEMLSLPAMEEAVKARYPDDDAGLPQAAIVPYEIDGERPKLGLFGVFDSDVESVNQLLRDAGFGNIARVQHVTTVPEIPLLGTGKADYRSLQTQLREMIENED
jgi:long-chain-fatty-acid--[acyl-carrier-protein] ligase